MKYDSGHLDALQLAVASPGYELIRDRILKMLELKRSELEQPAGAEKTAMLRGELWALRRVLELPKILDHEIRKNMTEAA